MLAHAVMQLMGQCKAPSNLDVHQRCPSPPPVCDDNNLCTNDSAFCRGHGLGWECSNLPKVCNPGTSCDETDGLCKSPSNLDLHQGCPSPPPLCEDNNLCTNDSAFCRGHVSGWECTNSPKDCRSGTSCDATDGQCRADDELVPCVAVIDEDSSFGGNQLQTMGRIQNSIPAQTFLFVGPNTWPEFTGSEPEYS